MRLRPTFVSCTRRLHAGLSGQSLVGSLWWQLFRLKAVSSPLNYIYFDLFAPDDRRKRMQREFCVTRSSFCTIIRELHDTRLAAGKKVVSIPVLDHGICVIGDERTYIAHAGAHIQPKAVLTSSPSALVTSPQPST